jgi:hypothetical protein
VTLKQKKVSWQGRKILFNPKPRLKTCIGIEVRLNPEIEKCHSRKVIH